MKDRGVIYIEIEEVLEILGCADIAEDGSQDFTY
jgi:hypothetical protein